MFQIIHPYFENQVYLKIHLPQLLLLIVIKIINNNYNGYDYYNRDNELIITIMTMIMAMAIMLVTMKRMIMIPVNNTIFFIDPLKIFDTI